MDAVYCTAVNDAFVMGAWAESLKAGDRIHMLADGSAEFARKVGLEQDLTARAFGVRSKRYTMLVVDGVVKVRRAAAHTPHSRRPVQHVGVDGPGTGIAESGAEAVLKVLASHPNL